MATGLWQTIDIDKNIQFLSYPRKKNVEKNFKATMMAKNFL